MLCASEPFTSRWPVHPAPHRGLEPTTTAFAFRSKVFQQRHPASVLLFWSKPLISAFLSSNPFQLTRLTAFISSTRSPASQQLSHLTEWREADAPEFSEPLTFFIAPFLMPSLLTLGGAPWRNKWEILEEQFDHRGAKKKKKKSSIFSFSSTLLGALLRMMRKGMASLRSQRRGLQKLFYVCFSVSVVYSYNIDLEHPLVFRGPKSSFFGYSVLEHYHDNTRWWVPFSNVSDATLKHLVIPSVT